MREDNAQRWLLAVNYSHYRPLEDILLRMHALLANSTPDLAAFLAAKLPLLSAEWWKQHVIQRLSFQQQRMVQERRFQSVEELDFAALLRVLDQNWYELSNKTNLPREGRGWVKELQTIRNKWAHQSSQTILPSEEYRDADTLSRFLQMIGARQSTIDAIEAEKMKAVAAMASFASTTTSNRWRVLQNSSTNTGRSLLD